MRKQEIKDLNKLRQDSNTINHGLKKKSTPFTSTSRACNKKFKTPTKDFLSPSKRDLQRPQAGYEKAVGLMAERERENSTET